MISISSDFNQDTLKHKLEELKEAWHTEWQGNETLESKAISIIQVAGTVTALIFGFVTFTQSTTAKLSSNPLAQGIIIASILFGVVSIILSIFVIRTRRYILPINPEGYFKDADFIAGQSLKPNNVRFYDENVRAPWDYEWIFKSYLISYRSVKRNNESKGNFVFAAVLFLIISVALTVAAVIAIFWLQSLLLPPQQGNAELTCKQLSTTETRIINGTNISAPSSSNKESKVMLCMSK